MLVSGFDPRREDLADGLVREEAVVASADGTPLRIRSWRPRDARASVSIVHGLAEHADRYAAVAVFLAARGFSCHAVDLRGHGRSGGTRVHVDSFDAYAADVSVLRARARDAAPGRPAFLLGHSMGGLVALVSALREVAGLHGLVLSSPFLGVHPALRPGPLMRAAAAVLLRAAPRLQVPSGARAEHVSRDPSVVAAYASDPLVSRTVSAGWFQALAAAQREVRAAATRWNVPTLVLAAGDDRLVDLGATRDWAAGAAAAELTVLPGLFHEIFNEPERAGVKAQVAAWLEERSSG